MFTPARMQGGEELIMIKTEVIKIYLKENELSKSAFCKKCKISFTTLKKVLEQDTSYNLVALFKIAHVLKIRVCELFV